MADSDDDFYVRYYVGRKGRGGFDFLEFEFQKNGKMRYVNNTKYKGEAKILKTAWVSTGVLEMVRNMIAESNVMDMDDNKWPEPNQESLVELEVIMDGRHVSFSTIPVGSSLDLKNADDPKTFQAFHHLTQDLRCLVLPLISAHFKINPLGKQSNHFE